MKRDEAGCDAMRCDAMICYEVIFEYMREWHLIVSSLKCQKSRHLRWSRKIGYSHVVIIMVVICMHL